VPVPALLDFLPKRAFEIVPPTIPPKAAPKAAPRGPAISAPVVPNI